jgi:hypothetical protein
MTFVEILICYNIAHFKYLKYDIILEFTVHSVVISNYEATRTFIYYNPRIL